MRPLLFSRVWLAAALLVAPGCVTLADLPEPKDEETPPAQDDPGQVVTEDPEGSDAHDGEPEPEPEPEPEVDSGKPDAGSAQKPEPEIDAGSAPCSGATCDAGTDAKVEVDSGFCSYPFDGPFTWPADCIPPNPPVPPPPPSVECNVNTDCGQGRYCVNNACQNRFVCQSHADCSPGEGCIDNSCRAAQLCQSTDQCAQNQLCVAGACAPRCNADNACIIYQGPADRSIRQFVTDDNALYFSLVQDPWVQSSGQLWRMVPGQAATLITDQLGPNMNFAVQNGYVYFRRGVTFIRRRVEAGAPEQALYAAPTPDTGSWAIGANFVVFSGYDGFLVGNLEGTMSLHSVAQDTSGVPKEVMAAGDRFYFVGKTRTPEQWELSRIMSVRAAEPFRVEDASPLFASDFSAIRDVRTPYAYFVPSWWAAPVRINLNDGSLAALPDFGSSLGSTHHMSNAGYSLIGDWLYSFEQISDNEYHQIATLQVTRYLASDWTRKQVVVPPRTPAESSASPTVAVLRDRFYTAKALRPDVIYEMTLPAPPN